VVYFGEAALLPAPHQANRKEKQKITKEILWRAGAVSDNVAENIRFRDEASARAGDSALCYAHSLGKLINSFEIDALLSENSRDLSVEG
jgi:hypothetical protein